MLSQHRIFYITSQDFRTFVRFGSGCDFDEDYDKDSFVMSKISMMNEFYALNRTHVFKRDGSSDKNTFSPVSMYFREEDWTQDEMFAILKEIGITPEIV